MAGNLGKWPSKRVPISKIMPSDGCKGDTIPLAVGKWYDFCEFGCHLGNVGLPSLRSEGGGWRLANERDIRRLDPEQSIGR